MDLSKFSDPSFDPKQWVNSVLRSSKESQTPVDVCVPCFNSNPANMLIISSSLSSLHMIAGTCLHTSDETTAVHTGDFTGMWSH